MNVTTRNKARVQTYLAQLMNNMSLPVEVTELLSKHGFMFVEGEIEGSVLWYRFEKKVKVRDRKGDPRVAVFDMSVGFEQDPVDRPATYIECIIGDLNFGTVEGIGTPELFAVNAETVEGALAWAELLPSEYRKCSYDEWEEELTDWQSQFI